MKPADEQLPWMQQKYAWIAELDQIRRRERIMLAIGVASALVMAALLLVLVSPARAKRLPPSWFFLHCMKQVPAPKVCRYFDGRP